MRTAATSLPRRELIVADRGTGPGRNRPRTGVVPGVPPRRRRRRCRFSVVGLCNLQRWLECFQPVFAPPAAVLDRLAVSAFGGLCSSVVGRWSWWIQVDSPQPD